MTHQPDSDAKLTIEEVSDCVILAGGAGSRMGEPKAFLNYDGKLLIERIYSTVEPLFDRVCASVKSTESLSRVPDLEWHAVLEDPPTATSLQEVLVNIIETVQAPTFIVAVDLPQVSQKLIRELCSSYNPGTSVIGVAEERPQPLAAVWDPSALDFSTPEDGDLALLAWVRRAPFKVLNWPKDFKFQSEENPFRNLNRPEDLSDGDLAS
ncbi:MAG: hypothetical protein CBC13_09120 [Planctomycetia bacterium TMED53]|nr:MAG: hypothetical protein CBC13_09120 [Planctomycetia bacterium TMED53]